MESTAFEPYEAAGIEAADVAGRMGLPDLASGRSTLRTRHGSRWANYNRMFPLWERRAELLPVLTDALEIGDCYSAGAWCLFELGRYPEAWRSPTTASSRSRRVPT
jgi:hypothetical protein